MTDREAVLTSALSVYAVLLAIFGAIMASTALILLGIAVAATAAFVAVRGNWRDEKRRRSGARKGGTDD